jgi:hypothetical protein
MIPVTSRKLTEGRRAQIVFEAHEFHAKGLFIQECTSPRFLRALSGDFFENLAPLQLQRYVAAQFAQRAIEDYFDRLEEALIADAAGTLRRNQSFLKVRTRKNRSGPEQND